MFQLRQHSHSVTRFDEILPFWQNLQVFEILLRVYLLLGNILHQLWQILHAIGQVFIYANGQMLKNNLTIWSHCSHARCLNESATLCLRKHDWNLNRFIYVETGVTRFGKTLPLWQNFTSLWQIFDSLFFIWENVEPTLANLEHYLANFHFLQMDKY